MRSLSTTLSANQKIGLNPLCKLVLTQQGDSTTHTYSLSSTNRVLNLSHIEQEWAHSANVLVDNRDTNLTALDLEGYVGVISYGFNDHTQGDEYSATAPLTVISQKNDTLLGRGSELTTSFNLAGLFNLWGEQEATENYTPDRINSDTVKTIMDAIAGATLTCFNTFPSHTITYDSGYDDDIINAFKPADDFTVTKGETRLSAFKKVLAYTKDKARVENDSGTATIHIFQPLITGESYDEEYNDILSTSNHNFYSKSVRERLVLPNKVIVMNHPDHDDSYTGSATDATSYAALGNQYYTETIYLRPASNAQCVLIATARMQAHQLAAEKGHGKVPMNVGQEMFDYIKFTDSAAGDTRVGNVGYLKRTYDSNFDMELRFGNLLLPGLAGTVPPSVDEGIIDTGGVMDRIAILSSMVNNLSGTVNNLIENQGSIVDYLNARKYFAEYVRLSVTDRFLPPQGIDKFTP